MNCTLCVLHQKRNKIPQKTLSLPSLLSREKRLKKKIVKIHRYCTALLLTTLISRDKNVKKIRENHQNHATLISRENWIL